MSRRQVMRKYEYRQARLCPRWISKFSERAAYYDKGKTINVFTLKTYIHEMLGLIMAQKRIN